MTWRQRFRSFLLLYALMLCAGCAVHARVDPQTVPLFHVTARVTSIANKPPVGKQFTFTLGKSTATVKDDAWCAPLAYTRADVEASLKLYPNLYLGRFPVVTSITITGVEDTTAVEGRITLDETGEALPFTARMYGSSLGLLCWRDSDKSPRVATMSDYNQRYWETMKQINIPVKQRPKFFPIGDRFIFGDNDRRNLEEGVAQLGRAGFNCLMMPPGKLYRDVLLKAGLSRTAWAVYNPPGYAFDYGADGKLISQEEIVGWAQELAKPYLDAGFTPKEMGIYVMSDEPGWYYPAQYEAMKKSPEAMARFRAYLAARGLTPEELGAKTWDEVQPLGRSKAIDLPARRLFYWTMRFISWDSSMHFARSSAALQKAFYPNLPTPTNFNFFSGRLYVPGPVANNSEKQNPDAAMGGHDWLEFGRIAGGVRMGSEDWFGDNLSYQWSFYCAKMRSATAKSGGEYGGYVIPRTAGALEDGIQQKILSIIGSGAKWLEYFVFGPEYVFPGNCYSENMKVLPKMAETHALIGKAESVLWPGRRPKTPVAILHPRSAQMWDAKTVAVPTMISDATNTNLNRATVDYLAEVADLYLALQHANIPVDFLDEDDLTAAGLGQYRVLYVTEPNIPVEGQRGLLEWVKGGGTVVMVSNAGSADRYDDPSDLLAGGLGLAEHPRERLLVANADALPEAGKGTLQGQPFTAYGPRAAFLAPPKDGILAAFADGAPAMVEKTVGAGAVVYFPWMPGISYYRSGTFSREKLPVGFSATLRAMITYPVEKAKVVLPVTIDRPMIETPLLVSSKGGAVTVLNWTGSRQTGVTLTVRAPFKVKAISSMKTGTLRMKRTRDGITCTIPALEGADILVLKR